MKVTATISKLLRFAVCMAGVALTAHAQNSYLVSSNPNEVIQTGVTELLGEIRLTKGTSGNTPQTTISSTITILYRNVLVQNAFTGSRNIDLASGTISDSRGITIRFSSDWLNDSISSRLSATVFGTGSGSLLAIEIPSGISLDADGESIAVTGVRATPTGLAVGADVTASISSTPSIAHSFLNGFHSKCGTSPVRTERCGIGSERSCLCQLCNNASKNHARRRFSCGFSRQTKFFRKQS